MSPFLITSSHGIGVGIGVRVGVGLGEDSMIHCGRLVGEYVMKGVAHGRRMERAVGPWETSLFFS